MKNLLKILFTILPLMIFAQDNIHFTEKSFNEILEKAEKENKLIFLDAYAAWCGPCKLMEKNVFTKKEIADYYNKNFINAHFDMEKGEGRELAAKYRVNSYPTLLFLNSKGEVITKSLGYLNPDQFLEFGKEAQSTSTLGTLKERFEKGESSPEFLLNVMREYVDADYPTAKKASERYFQNKTSAVWTKDDIGLLLYFIQSTEDSNYKVFNERKSEIIKIIPEQAYLDFDSNIKLHKLLAASLDEKNGNINEKYYLEKAIPLVGESQAKKLLNQLKLNFYASTRNLKGYQEAAKEYYKNPNDFEPTELLRAAWFVSENISDPETLKKAETWAANAVIRMETPESTFILAKLYQKTGKKDLAKMYAETSIRIAEQTGADATAAKQIVSDLK